MEEAQVLRRGTLDMQVCVPGEWLDDEVKAFADRLNPCGTSNGWTLRREGDSMLGSDPERNLCSRHEGFVHVVLDA